MYNAVIGKACEERPDTYLLYVIGLLRHAVVCLQDKDNLMYEMSIEKAPTTLIGVT